MQRYNKFLTCANLTRKNYSRYELSKRTGIHKSQIIRIERGENIPRVDTLMKIFDELSLQVRITQPDLIYICK